MSGERNNDLPLVSNVNDILVKHYLFNFICDMSRKCFKCCTVLFLQPVLKDNESDCKKCNCSSSLTSCDHFSKNSDGKCILCSQGSTIPEGHTFKKSKAFLLILDCHKIIVDEVAEISFASNERETLKYTGCKPTLLNASDNLNFETDDWSLKIWKNACNCKFCFPRIIRISYKTMAEGPSLLWVNDQDKNPAVFTYGAWVNNRSLFPCQEPPIAMATWEATVAVKDSAVVLMSGDEEAHIFNEDGLTHYYYYTKSVLPLSTLCLAIGFWEAHPIMSKLTTGPKCRIFSPSSLLDKAIEELFEYVPYCIKISEDVLGPYPFPRVDFLIVPPTFGSLGMASPNIVFLSQSLLTGDNSMCSRVAHEIAHGWFGLLIGALDWTEEWLSEGFATFVEDYLHVWIKNMQENEAKDYIEIKTFIRLKTLLQEVDNTNEELQILRPSQGKPEIRAMNGTDVTILKNGQNPMKAFVQVHYIKGYFLLKHLSDVVGINPFLHFLKGYIEKFKGQLVTSKDFLTAFFQWFPDVQKLLTIENIYENWLHNPGIASPMKSMKPSSGNMLHKNVLNETKKWIRINSSNLKRKSKRRKGSLEHMCELTSEQKILLLENLLEESALSILTLKSLDEFFRFKLSNAEVQHRWFELVVKYKYKSHYKDLKIFLNDHLAMGVYLFGEMIFSGDPTLQCIAKECYAAAKSEMEPNYVTTIEQMLDDALE